ncbi:MAG TPA: DUF4157 domain-containing protein [Acidobacteriaceae bacterium]|jgi:hypothetical protein|nr:DUF4157 domain-containing protein [Acidobacteriaceae bacterium]
MNHAILARKTDSESSASARPSAGGLKVNRPGDTFEQEADRVADRVSAGGKVPAWSFSRVSSAHVQRDTPATDPNAQPSPQPNNYKEGAEKLGEAFLKTDVGKKLQDAASQDPLVKGASDFVGTLPGKIIAGAAGTAVVAGLAAEHKALPVQIPEIPLDKVAKGLKVKITYEGPVDRPTKGMVTFTYTPGGDKKKKGPSESDKVRSDTARLQAEQDDIRKHTTYAPGSQEAKDEKATQKAIEDMEARRGGMLPGTGGVPLKPGGIFQQSGDVPAPGLLQQTQPDTGLRLPTYQSPFAPKAPTLLDKQLELKPITSQPGAADAKKKEETTVQRKADGNAAVLDSPARVPDALDSSSRPLDEATQRLMESRIGFDFSKVRIHTDAQAAESAKSVHALAYTVGNDIVFSAGRYAPASSEGQRLLAHELTHVVQQHPGTLARSLSSAIATPRASKGESDDDLRRLATDPTQGATGTIPLHTAEANLKAAESRRTAQIRAHNPHFRVPTAADVKALFTSSDVPKAVLKDRIQIALSRMAAEKRLKTTDSVPEIMDKIFPASGTFDEAAYAAVVDVNDRSEVYQTVLDAEAQVTSGDKPKLTAVMEDSAKLIGDCAADAADLQSVFGGQKDVAKAVYGKAAPALRNAITHIDTNVTTDYNLDDPETGLGGWAVFASQHAHFRAAITKVVDKPAAEITIIHEACHLADDTVKDKGYYNSPGFEAKPEDVKVTNAAHYEEIPRRKLGRSKFPDPKAPTDGKAHFLDFKPGTTATGAPQSFDDNVKEIAVDAFRKAWDKAMDVDIFLRNIRKDELAGNTTSFAAHKPRILEISKVMHLTVHEQPDATASLNQLDIVVAEGVTRAMGKMGKLAASEKVPNPFELKVPSLNVGFQPPRPQIMTKKLELKPIPGLSVPPGPPVPQTEDQAAASVIINTLSDFGNLTGSLIDDKTLVDWLDAEYKKPL